MSKSNRLYCTINVLEIKYGNKVIKNNDQRSANNQKTCTDQEKDTHAK